MGLSSGLYGPTLEAIQNASCKSNRFVADELFDNTAHSSGYHSRVPLALRLEKKVITLLCRFDLYGQLSLLVVFGG